MLVNGIRETLRVAHDAATDASVVLRDLAVEVQEVRSWTLETAQREVTALTFGRVPPNKNRKRRPEDREHALRLNQGSASSSETKSAKNQVRASLRNRGGVGTATPREATLDAGCASVAGPSSGCGTGRLAPTNGCDDGDCLSAPLQHETVDEEATFALAPVSEKTADLEEQAVLTLPTLHERGAEWEEQEPPWSAAEQGEGGEESRTVSEPTSTPVGTVGSLLAQVEGKWEEDGEEMSQGCTRQNRQQGCANGEETRKLPQKEVAKRQWAEAVKKIRLMREEEEATRLRGQVVVTLNSPRMEDQDDEPVIYVDQDQRYSLEQLTQTKVWQSLGVQPSAREFYLTDDEFERLFEMDRHDYIKLPKWKRIALKKKHNLF
mmetsp:Transcript_29113/g.56286  ORF Transcript_29113/g.56286 Transcript_29113/m.56286 type:complete len:378 (-) Transcript_29113:96-1229(-)